MPPAPGKLEADRGGWFVRDYFPSGVAPVSKILFDGAGTGTGVDFGASSFTTGIDMSSATISGTLMSINDYNKGIRYLKVPGTQGDAYGAIMVGYKGSPLDTAAAVTDDIRLIQASLQGLDGPASGYKEMNCAYFNLQTDGAHALTYSALNVIHTNTVIDQAIGWCYGIQSDVTKSDNGAIDDCYAMTAYFNTTGGPTFTASGRVAALSAHISASGGGPTITGEVYAAWIANRGQMSADAIVCFHNQSAATATEAILMELDGTVTQFIQFNGTICDAWTTADQGATGGHFKDEYVKIPVKVAGVTPQLYILAAETWAT